VEPRKRTRDAVTVRVPAKLNLQLAVGPPRADGYHDLVTVFHAVSLFDEVTVTPAARDAVTVTGEGADRVPAGPDNLALRAVAALRTAVADPAAATGVHIAIIKRIPVAAGLAGGSADAAAALAACNVLWSAAWASRSCSRSRPGWAATCPSRCSAGPPWAAAGGNG